MSEDSGYDDLMFDVRRSVRYHDKRILFFDHMRKLIAIITLLSGTTAFLAVLGSAGGMVIMLATLIVAVLSLIDIVTDPAGQARRHDDLKRRFIDLERRMTLEPGEDVKVFTADRLAIEADEPPVLRVLDTICYNEICRAMGYDPEACKPLTRAQRFFAQFFDLFPNRLQA
jgi:hypothetical protein